MGSVLFIIHLIDGTPLARSQRCGEASPNCNGAEGEIGAERIIQLICHHWSEENAIKELLDKHLIDFTPGYASGKTLGSDLFIIHVTDGNHLARSRRYGEAFAN